MGSRYSTRWRGHTARTMVVDRCRLSFDARALVRRPDGGFVGPGGILEWLDEPPVMGWRDASQWRGREFAGGPQTRACFVPDAVLHRREPQIHLAFRAHQQPSGGLVWRLVCPACYRRRLTLYWIDTGPPTCRTCAGLVYASQRATPRGRAALRMEKLTRLVVPWWSDPSVFPELPRRMHQNRYLRIRQAWKNARWESLSKGERDAA